MTHRLLPNQQEEPFPVDCQLCPRRTQQLVTVFDGISRHSPEGLNLKARSESVGWKQAVEERDQGRFDWTRNRQIPGNAD